MSRPFSAPTHLVPAYMWAEEETVIQLHGVGPLRTDFVTPGEGG